MAKLESGYWTSRLIWQIELSRLASSLTLALRDTRPQRRLRPWVPAVTAGHSKSSHLTDQDGWLKSLSYLGMAEDLHCESNEDRWALMRDDLGDALCHPSSGHRPEDHQGGLAAVLGRWGGSSSVSSGMREKDEMRLQCVSSSALSRSADVRQELSSNTWFGGSIVREPAELGRDLTNGKTLALRAWWWVSLQAVITCGTAASEAHHCVLSYFLHNVTIPSLFWSLPCWQLIQLFFAIYVSDFVVRYQTIGWIL